MKMRHLMIAGVFIAPSSDGEPWASCVGCGVGAGAAAVHVARELHENEVAAERRRHWATRNWVMYRLAPGDVVEEDASGHVTAVRHATSPPTWTRFKAGAVSPPNENIVWGEIAELSHP